MNEREEQRVIETLQALTGGLTVTEEDIITAGGRLRDRLEPRPPRRRPALLVAAAAAALVLVGYVAVQAIDRDGNAAPPADRQTHAPAEEPANPAAEELKAALQADAYSLPPGRFTAGSRPTSSDLAGLWMLRAPWAFLMFVEGNGDWRLNSPTSTLAYGTSTLAGGTLTRRLDERSGCARGSDLVGYSQSWHAALARDGSLRVALKDTNITCTPAEDREVWDRVDPGSPVAGYLLAAAQDAEWRGAPDRFPWKGLYVAPATGHVLDVARDGHYRYYDSLAETLADADRGVLEFRPGLVRASCAGGDFSGTLEVARLPGVDGYVFPFRAIRVTPATNGCASGVADEGVWVNLSS